jgi:4-amino-4-deoxy-L-arabinose transferase-like glycosyltransferase
MRRSLSWSISYWLLGIIYFGAILRLYHLTTPLADWHSFRQADTASVAREYLNNGLDLLRPRYHDLSNIQSGKDNPEGYRMVEFPLISGLVALTYPAASLITGWPLHVWYRFTSILFSIGSLAFLYLIGQKLFNRRVATFTVLMFALLPYNIFYSRTVLPEIPMVFFSLVCLYLGLSTVSQPRWWRFLLMGLTGAVALLIKPTAAFMLISLVIPLYFGFKKNPQVLVFWLPTLLFMGFPLYLWRQWILNFPTGIPASEWLLNGNGIRLRPAWFRWLFYERLTKIILGYFGLITFTLGLYALFKKQGQAFWFTLIWGLGSLLYLIIFATGNVQHDYYQIITIPVICLVLGLGLDYVFLKKSQVLTALVSVSLILGLTQSWRIERGLYQINNWAIVHAGQAVAQLTPPEALVIAPYMGDTAFLYQTNRRGWPIGFDIDQKIHAGAQYYASVNFDDEANALMRQYPVVIKTPEFVILKLTAN